MTQNEFIELCADGDYTQIADAIESGCDPNTPAQISENATTTPIFAAASSANFEALRALTEYGADCAEGFIAATIAGNPAVMRELVKLGGNIDAQDSESNNALYVAVTMNKTEMVKLILELGADVNLKAEGGRNVLTYAAMMASKMVDAGRDLDPEILTTLVKAGADYTDAMAVAFATGAAELAHTILNAGADPDTIVGDTGKTFMMYAVMSGGEIVSVLLGHGADPNICDSSGHSPLMMAVLDEETDPSVIDVLAKGGADVNARNKNNCTPLIMSAMCVGEADDFLMPALIRTGGLMAKGWRMWSAFISLHVAARREIRLEKMRRLLRNGADISLTDDNGMNALMYSLIQGDDEAADILSEAGAAINFNFDNE